MVMFSGVKDTRWLPVCVGLLPLPPPPLLSPNDKVRASSSLVPTPENKLAVWIFDPVTKIVSRRVIESGAPTQSGVPVTAGLQPGEQVVVAGGSQLQEGMQVRPL